MRTFPISWLIILLMPSAILNPMCAIGAEPNAIHPRAPLMSQPSHSPGRATSTPSSSLTALNRQTRARLVVPGVQTRMVPAGYTTSQPPYFRSPRSTPTLNESAGFQVRTAPRQFVGPRQENNQPKIPVIRGIGHVDETAPISIPALFPENALSAMQQPLGNEYDRMNDASREILHGGN